MKIKIEGIAGVRAVVRATLNVIKQAPRLTVSEWADQFRVLSPESSAEPGRWHTSRVPYMKDVMDALSDPGIIRVVVPKAAQVSYTEAVNNTLGYYMSQDPAPILIVQPSLEIAEAWSKDRLAPMIRDTPVLRSRVHDPKERDSGNTIRQKIFPGGRLTVVGANAARGLASRPIRIVLGDEVDGWPLSAGAEGDPLTLASKRQVTFWNKKTLLGSTPLHRITSVIWREYLQSDQRRYHVPCPQCDTPQVLTWKNVRWDKTPEGAHKPETAHYVCEHCGAIWGDADRHEAVKHGKWVADAPGGSVAGFHIPGFLSPWLTLEEIVREFLKAKSDPLLLQVWTNTVLGEPFEEASERIDGSGLSSRGESYSPQSVPNAVRLITTGIDIQVDRLEIQVVGWGAGEESWVLAYEIIHGDPAQPPIWEEVEALLLAPMRTDTGRELRIKACCIDVGDSPHANAAMEFCKTRRVRRIFPTKGIAGTRPVWPKMATRTRKNQNLYMLGVDTAKSAIYGRLRITKPGPGYIHFPAGQDFDERYFQQLTSEQVSTRYREGRPYRVWFLPSGRRNEALDTAVLALAARLSMSVRLDAALVVPATPPPAMDVAEGLEDVASAVSTPEPPPPPPQPVAQSSGVKHSRVANQSWMQPRRGWFK